MSGKHSKIKIKNTHRKHLQSKHKKTKKSNKTKKAKRKIDIQRRRARGIKRKRNKQVTGEFKLRMASDRNETEA